MALTINVLRKLDRCVLQEEGTSLVRQDGGFPQESIGQTSGVGVYFGS